VVDRQDVWGETAYRVWLPAKDAVVRARSQDWPAGQHPAHGRADPAHRGGGQAAGRAGGQPAAGAHPVQRGPAAAPALCAEPRHEPHRIRYLLADEVGLGKTIEAGLILRELKLRGMAKRILVVAPKGLVRQWQAEMRLHFGEKLQFIEPAELAAFRQWRNDEENLWRMHDQVICSLDSVKPMEGRAAGAWSN
jgi:hypothetical protein